LTHLPDFDYNENNLLLVVPHQTEFQPTKKCSCGGKTMDERLSGTVKWFNTTKGYGFLSREDGPDVFVHYTAIESEGEFRNLVEGQPVEFSIIQGAKGLQADKVRVI
jgi:CspA family cold shock protein